MQFANLDIQGAIFDLDGTILDSMRFWDNVGSNYLRYRGVEPDADIDASFKHLSLEESAALLQRRYGFSQSVDDLVNDVLGLVEQEFIAQVKLKSDIATLLAHLHASDVPMCIATVNERRLAQGALERNGVARYFGACFTVGEVGASKQYPRIFELAHEWLGTPKDTTAVFEDALHAAKVAKSVGLKIVGLYDHVYADDSAEFAQFADVYLGQNYKFARYLK